ncbi:hypothetical protein ES703_69458 [subsurface metagenome]
MNGVYLSVMLLTILLTSLPAIKRNLKKKKGNLMDGREYMLRLRRTWRPRGEELHQTKLIYESHQIEIDADQMRTEYSYRHSRHLNVT